MDEHLWERLSCDEYFIRSMNISPILAYDESPIAVKTVKVQAWLISKYNSQELTREEVVSIYEDVMRFSDERNNVVVAIKKRCEEIISYAKKESDTAVEQKLDSIIASYEM